MNNNYNHYNDGRDYYQRNQSQDRRYQNNQYGPQSPGYNQQYNNSYDSYQQNRYDTYPQRYQSYPQNYDAYQSSPRQQQQYQYNPNMYNQVPQQHPPQYQYGQPYNQQYPNMPPGDLGQSQQSQGPIPNDQEYMNSKLIDFRGRLHDYIPYASPRRAIVRLYSGKQTDDWLITELIQNIKTFIEYKAGVTFLYNIQSKMTYKSQSLVDSIVNNYENILKISEGYKLFSKIAYDVNPDFLSNISQWCFDSYLQYQNNDPDFMALLSTFVQILSKNPTSYLKMINLSVYLSNPPISVVGCSIIENCSEELVVNFVNEINNNSSTLINDKDLIELIVYVIDFGPKSIRDSLFNTFYQQVDTLLNHPWRWKICNSLLNLPSMSQKTQVAEKICRNCTIVREKFMDELILNALMSVSDEYRRNSLLPLLGLIIDSVDYPIVNDFVKNITYADNIS